jgi:hypothetical protein
MSQRASGTFAIKLEPPTVALGDEIEGATRRRMSIDRQFGGELTGITARMGINVNDGVHSDEFEPHLSGEAA